MTIYSDEALAIKAWNLLGGLDWGGLSLVADVLGISDVETLIYQLAAIQNHLNKRAAE